MVGLSAVNRGMRHPGPPVKTRSGTGAAALLAAALAIHASAAQSTDLERLTDAERGALQAEIRSYLLENPEILIEIVAELEARRAAAQIPESQLIQNHAEELFRDSHSWVGGNPAGDVNFVEFIDYRCGYCRRAYGDVETLVETDPGIRFIVKEFPILGHESVRSARLALAALNLGGSDAYKLAHDRLIKYDGPVSGQYVREFAADAGLDPESLAEQMDGEAVSSAIAANQALANALSINGTPAFVIEGTLVRGWIQLADMRQLVESARAPAQ